MKRYFYFVISLMALMAATAVAYDGAESSAPEAASTPTTADTPMAPAASTPSVADTPTPGTTPAEPPAPDTDDNLPAAVYEVLLGTIPDTPEARSSVYINDYTLVRQMFDIPLPGPGDDEDALEVYYDYRPPLSGCLLPDTFYKYKN